MDKIALNYGGGASRSLKAFTLAEVLITLAIIGVVAALTIPTTIANYKNQEIATKLKKSYNTITNAINRAQVDHGSFASWDFSLQARDFGDRYIFPYLEVVKKCPANTVLANVDTDCFKGGTFSLRGSQTSDTASLNSSRHAALLKDGTSVAITQPLTSMYTFIVDIDGPKGVSTFGRDIFLFYIVKPYSVELGKTVNWGAGAVFKFKEKNNSMIYPSGYGLSNGTILASNSVRSCSKADVSNAGTNCAGFIANNGWKIPSREQYVKLGGDASLYPW
ncbi:MAG: type II secretion system protein [Cyanobacteria bacterium SIG30]|nr:type II secretion system protein [Cyanobacteria bacterium SIG30]